MSSRKVLDGLLCCWFFKFLQVCGGIVGTFELVCLLSSAHRADDRRVAALNGMSLVGHGECALHVGVAARDKVLSVPTFAIQRRIGLVSRLFLLVRLAVVCLKARPRLIIASEPDTWGLALVAKICVGCRVIFDSHEEYTDVTRLRLIPKMCRFFGASVIRILFAIFLQFSDGVLVITCERARLLGAKLRAPALIVVRNALCRRETLELPRGNPATMGRLDAFAIGAMGRERGWPTIVKGLALTPKAPFRCLLIGMVTDGSQTALADEVHRYGVGGRLRYAGFLPRKYALEMASYCQVGFVLFVGGGPNQESALPHKLFEIMALGLPVLVSSHAKRIVSLIKDVGCGISIDTSHDSSLSDSLFQIFFSPIDRAVMGELSRLVSLGRLAFDNDAKTLTEFCGILLENDR